MKAFFILKPDALERCDVIKTYQDIMNSEKYIRSRQQYLINSWVDLSCQLYDPDELTLSKEELIKIRRQMITTIKAYDYLYPNKSAVLDLFDIPDDLQVLKRLETIKYQIRKQFVMNTDKNYFKFLNLLKEDLLQPLKNIDIRSLKIEHVRVGCNEEITDDYYWMAYLNCLHFPDPNSISIARDLKIIETPKVLTKKIIL